MNKETESAENTSQKNKFNFQKLTPLKDINKTTYVDSLDYALNDSEILNIAMTGIYGAGKSSILASYEEKHKDDMKFIHISLACFKDNNSTKDDSKADEQKDSEKTKTTDEQKLTNTLEGKIINQLIHQIAPENIPQTEFKIKKEVDEKSTNALVASIGFLLIACIYAITSGTMINFTATLEESFSKFILNLLFNPLLRAFFVVFSFPVFFGLLHRLIQGIQIKNYIKKINFQRSGIELFEKTKDAHFDKHLDEVLYIFRKCDASIIVFQDIDRYDNVEIFQKIREINTLVNVQ